MSVGRDPLDALGAAWRSLAPPDPAAALDAPDPATRAAIDWMRAAWQAGAPAAPTAIPWRLRLRLARPSVRPLLPWIAAAAATLLVALLLRPAPSPPPGAEPVELAAHPHPPEPSHAGSPGASPELVSLSADRMELRSGPVRLILFTPGAEQIR